MKDFLRKQIVNLKRAPQRIPLVLLVVCCIIYTFSLTEHSNASIYVSSNIVALYVFIITLSSMLAIFSYINAYSGGKENKLLFIISVAVVLLQVLFGALYLKEMYYEVALRENPVPITPEIAKSMNMTTIHIVALVFTLIMMLLKPIYHKALMRIDTTRYDIDESNIKDDTSIFDEFPDEDELNW